MKNRFDLIIFDWDGTLVNSIEWIVHCIQTAAEENGCAIPEQQDTKDIIGLSIKNAMQKLFPGIDEETQQQLVKRYSELFFSKTITQSDLFAGVYPMLEDLKKAGYQLAVATGKNRTGLDRALLGTQTAELFAITKCADETMSKPNPTMLNEIVEQLAVSKQRALMVGDSIHDLQMATNAEIASVGVACGAHPETTLKHFNPLHCLQQTHELFELL
jgi:phosphoglycolate phosphatase